MLMYIHVPFCRSKCSYCAFHSQALGPKVTAAHSQELQFYVDKLFAEIAIYGEKFPGSTLDSIFFGGGTPSLLPPGILDAILNRLQKSFGIAQKAEITLEVNPESVRGRNPFPSYKESGINRLSIGIQSLDDETLRILGRPHKTQDSFSAIYAARAAGFSNVNVDLMWGLPGQSMRQWLQSLKEMIKLSPDHISTYGLSLEPGTPLELAVEKGELQMPPERDQSIMYLEGSALLEANGYIHYEISNFSKMGYQCRHNMGYWEGLEYLGLGPSSTSTVNGRRWTNPASLTAWGENLGNFENNFETITPKTKVLELIMLRLRTSLGLRLSDYRNLTGRDFIRDHQKFIQTLHENGLAKIRSGYLSLTTNGMLVSNAIISNLFERVNVILDKTPVHATAFKTPGNDKLDSVLQKPAISAVPVVWPKPDDRIYKK